MVDLLLGTRDLLAFHRAKAGTFGGIVPVRAIDGRSIAVAPPGGITRCLAGLYANLKDEEAAGYVAQTKTLEVNC